MRVTSAIDPDPAADEVTVDVQTPEQFGVRLAAIDVTPDHCLADGMGVRDGGSVVAGGGGAAAGVVDVVALAARPAEVPSTFAVGDSRDFLVPVLPDVGDPQVASGGIHGEPPGVAQP